MFSSDTQLTARSHNGVDLIRRGGNLRRHPFRCLGEGVEVLFRTIHSFPDIRERGLKIHTGFDRCRTQSHNRSSDSRGQCLSGFRQGFGKCPTLLREVRQRCSSLRPCGLHPVQLFRQFFDLRIRLPGCSLGIIQVSRGFGSSIRAVLHGLLQGLDLAFQLGNFGGCFSMLLLIPFQILLCGDGGGVGFPEGIPVLLICHFAGFHLKAQSFLTGLCLFQPGRVILVPVIVLFQLIIGGNKCTAVLLHSAILLGELVSQHGDLRFGSGDGLLKVLHPGTGQTEGGLGFLDLLVDGAHIAREIAGVQRQRDHQFAQGFSHESSPLFIAGDSGTMVE